MIYTLKNTARRPLVLQLTHRVAGGSFKTRSEVTTRIDHDAKGNAKVRRVRLRHPPVLRARVGEHVEVPMSVMHDPGVKKAIASGGLRVIREETEAQWRERKLAEKDAEAKRKLDAEAKRKRQADELAKAKERRRLRDAERTHRTAGASKPKGKSKKAPVVKDGQE